MPAQFLQNTSLPYQQAKLQYSSRELRNLLLDTNEKGAQRSNYQAVATANKYNSLVYYFLVTSSLSVSYLLAQYAAPEVMETCTANGKCI